MASVTTPTGYSRMGVEQGRVTMDRYSGGGVGQAMRMRRTDTLFLRDAQRVLLVSLVFCALVAPLAFYEGVGATIPPVHKGELSLLPRAGGLFSFSSATRSEPASVRPAVISPRIANGLVTVDVGHPVWFVFPRTELPTDYRLAFLLPVFNSKYKRYPLCPGS